MTPTRGIAEWAVSRLTSHDKVARVALLSDAHVLVERNDLSQVVIGLTAVERLNAQVLAGVIDRDQRTSFVANVPKEALIDGSAFALASSRRVAIGPYVDLLRALSSEDPRKFVNRETHFIERGLRQHTSVASIERLDDRRYLIHRIRYRDLIAVFLHDYQLSADSVRTARERYGAFDVVVRANPNGGISQEAREAATAIGSVALEWRNFLGRLNSP